MRSSSLLSEAVIKAAHAANKHLSKFYKKEEALFPSERDWNLDFKNPNGKIVKIPRPNHGLLHSISVAVFVPYVIEFMKKHGHKDNGLMQEIYKLDEYSIECLQIAALFSVTGRLDEIGGNIFADLKIAKRYREYCQASADYFVEYAKETGMSKYDLAFWHSVILEMGNTPFYTLNKEAMENQAHTFPIPSRLPHIADLVLHFAHCLHLFRCRHLDKDDSNPLLWLKELSDTTHPDFENDYKALMQFACNVLIHTGNKLKSYMDNDGVIKPIIIPYREIFCQTNTDVDMAIKIIGFARHHSTFENPVMGWEDLKSAEVFLPQDGKGYYLAFADVDQAENCLLKLRKTIFRAQPSILDTLIHEYTFKKTSTPYRFRLSSEQFECLRKILRQNAPLLKPEGDFFYKTIRADEYNYIYRFLAELDDPNVRFPKRKGIRENYTVDGEDIKKRRADLPGDFPLKESQYTKEEKANYTTTQSASLGFEGCYPAAFGFDKREVLAGFMFPEKEVLKSNSLWIYDGGTVNRAAEFMSMNIALKFKEKKVGKMLFSTKQYDDYKNAVMQNTRENKYNEPMVRFHCNGEKTAFIYTDNLETRLLAKHYAEMASSYGKKTLVCFYTPNNPEILFREYTQIEYHFDCIDAKRIVCADANIVKQKITDKRFEYMLGLSEKDVSYVFANYAVNKLPLPLYMLSQGYVHMFRFLSEKISYFPGEALKKLLKKHNNNQKVMVSILYHALRSGYKELADYIYNRVNFTRFKNPLGRNDDSPLIAAVEMNDLAYVKLLLKEKWTNLEAKDYLHKNTALYIAVINGSEDIVRCLLTAGANVDTVDRNGWNILVHAIRSNNLNIVKMLLKKKVLLEPIQNKSLQIDYTYPLFTAACNGQAEIVRHLIEKGVNVDIQYNKKDDGLNDFTAMHCAIYYGSSQAVIANLLNIWAHLNSS